MLGSHTVEQIVREKIYTEAQSLTSPHKLLPYSRVALFLLLVFTAVSIGVKTLAFYLLPLPDPFAPFTVMLPGQDGSVIEGQKFSCYWEDDEYQIAKQHCAIRLATGVVADAGIVISKDRIIQYATFILRPNTVLLGDLMAVLGKPTFHRYGKDVEFSWPASGVTALVIVSRYKFSPFMPLWIVSFTLP
jgi:hypothetical protein